MAWPFVVLGGIALCIFVVGILTLPLFIYYSRRASQIEADRVHKALHEKQPLPDTYEQRMADRAARIEKQLEDFDERLKGR